MKKITSLLALLIVAMLVASCNDSETYADQKKKEAAAINSFLEKQGIKVISESEFLKDTLTDVSKKEFVLFENTGIYLQIVRKGCGGKIKNGETARVLCRFNEYNLLLDTLVTTNNILYYASVPEKMSVTNTLGTFTATFVSGLMMSKYSTTSVPAGWLIPLTYINVGRMVAEGDELARVNVIVPHSQGTSSALASVIPCYYEITYERGI